MHVNKVDIRDPEGVTIILCGDFTGCLANSDMGARIYRLNTDHSIAMRGVGAPEAFLISATAHVLRIGVDGLCDTFVSQYAELVRVIFPEAVTASFETGFSSDAGNRRDGYAWCGGITISREDGTRVFVPRFQIRRYVVTAAEFSKFSEATGYVTDAEKEGDLDGCFLTNTTMATDSGQYPVVQVSFNDAVAYCAWKRSNLPTEEQWLATAVLDWHENADDPGTQYPRTGKQFLAFGNAEWVRSTDERPSEAVYRVGPVGLRKSDWQRRVNRLRVPKTYRTLVLSFRTVI